MLKICCITSCRKSFLINLFSCLGHFSMIIIIIFAIIINTCCGVQRNTDIHNVRRQYTETYNRESQQNDQFCSASKEVKAYACFVILSNLLEYKIYLNLSAIYKHNGIPCKDNDVIIDENNNTLEQRMFPCYGRHHPLQTSWELDDFYEFVYLSQGPQANSFFVYYFEPTPDDDRYFVKEIITEFSMTDFQLFFVSVDAINIEQQSLQYPSYNTDTRLMEVNYIRNIRQNIFSVENSVCNFSRENKLKVCRIMANSIQESGGGKYILDENKFASLPLNCESKNIHYFLNHPSENESQGNMFTCYGRFSNDESTENSFQLSDGYRAYSILAFSRFDPQSEIESYSFRVSIHNIDLENINQMTVLEPAS